MAFSNDHRRALLQYAQRPFTPPTENGGYMGKPLAYLLTWTTHGTWLHGDVRGSVDAAHNRFGTPYLDPDEDRHHSAARILQGAPLILTPPMRGVVRDAIVEHCPFRNIHLIALSVRTNHVHLVTTPGKEPPGELVGKFKAKATRRLREHALTHEEAKVWTHRSSTRYLWAMEHLLGARHYVLYEQGAPDEFTVGPPIEALRSVLGTDRSSDIVSSTPAPAGGSDSVVRSF